MSTTPVFAEAPTPSSPARREVAFVDTSVNDWQTLVEGIQPGIEVVLLDGSGNGLAQMAEWAATHSGYDAIHVLSHGTAGQVRLGTATLDAAALTARAAELTQLGAALNADGDLLFYGCNVAAGQVGVEFVQRLAQATGADVAASEGLTGAAALGGDWSLESHSGPIGLPQLAPVIYADLLATAIDDFVTGVTFPTDLEKDAQNNLYVASGDINGVVKFAASGGAISGGAAGSAFIAPPSPATAASMAIDALGNLYIGTGSNTMSLLKYTASGGIPGNAAPTTLGTGFNMVSNIWVASDGFIYLADNGADKVYQIPSSGGPYTPATALASATVPYAGQIYIDSSNNLYVTSASTGKVIKFPAAAGAVSLSSPIDFITGLNVPTAITSDGAGNFYVGDGDENDNTTPGHLYKFGASGGTVAANGTLEHTFTGTAPSELLWGGDNTLYATLSNGTISKLVVSATNNSPTISDVGDQTTTEGTATSGIAVTIGDTETAATALTLAGTSSDTTLIPDGNIVVTGTGANRTVTITPAANQTGTATITLTVTDGGSATVTDTFTVTVSDVNPAISDATFSVPENVSNGTLVGTVIATGDANGLSYSITGGNTGSVFAINSSTGQITVNGSLNYENTDSYSLTVAVDDEDADTTADDTATITVNISNVNEAPTDLALGTTSFNNSQAAGTMLTTITGTDPDGGALTYTLVNGTGSTDNAKFEISGNSLKVASGAALEPGTYSLRLRATDDGSLTYEEEFSVTVTDAAPPTLSSTSPADDATGVALSALPQLVFAENIAFGTGSITLINVTDNTTVETFDVATEQGTGNGQVSISDNTLTINPTAALVAGKQYAIQIAATAIKDSANNAFAGIANNTSYNFETVPPPPGITLSKTSANVTEGGVTDTYTVVLNAAPTADVTIHLGNTNSQVAVASSSLTFTTANWATPQTVTLTALNDTVGEGKHSGVIRHTVSSGDTGYNNLAAVNLPVHITDNDLPTSDPTFIRQTGNFGLSDVGDNASPTFVDIDSDGDLDAFLGNGSYSLNMMFFRNTGTASGAAFTQEGGANPFGLSALNGLGASPVFVDIDKDGDLDAFLGTSSDDIQFFRNTATPGTGNPIFTLESSPFSSGTRGMPAFADIDADGDLDAFVGQEWSGEVYFYRNTAATGASTPSFFNQNLPGLYNAASSPASPELADIDGDGDLDILVGNGGGNTLLFRNTGTPSAPAFATSQANPFGLANVTANASPALERNHPDW